MIIILTRHDLKIPDQHITEIDIRAATQVLGHELTARASRIEFHDFNGWVRVIKDRYLERPAGYLPKTQENGFGEADRINHVGYHKADFNQKNPQPVTQAPESEMKSVGFIEKYPVGARKLVLDGETVGTKGKHVS